jgi:hypothetical protein
MTEDRIPPIDDARAREADLPEHERDENETIGGGVLSSGGTAIDRGTGELSGTAQGPGAGDEPEGEGVVPPPGMAAGGTMPAYAPAPTDERAMGRDVVEEDEEEDR